jgi:hypothetical protein
LRQLYLHPEAGAARGHRGDNEMTIEIDAKYKQYYLLDKKKGSIDQFVCPVEGCGFQTDQGPGALRMHMVISADPNCKGRHCKKHEEFVREHPETVSLQWVHYLAKFPSKLHSETEISNIKE